MADLREAACSILVCWVVQAPCAPARTARDKKSRGRAETIAVDANLLSNDQKHLLHTWIEHVTFRWLVIRRN